MTRIMAIDPGPEQSGWCLYDDGKIVDSGVDANHVVRQWVRDDGFADVLAIETMQASYSSVVGVSVMQTMLAVGRFFEAWVSAWPMKRVPLLISRQTVKAAVCNGNVKVNDAGVRQALIDTIGPPGTKKAPGPTYGVKSHAWSALAVAVAAERGVG